MPRNFRFPAVSLAAACLLFVLPANAQFGTAFPGFIRLPDHDFIWTWGRLREGDIKRSRDFQTRGYEASFSCDLTGRLRPGSRMTRSDIRNLEQSLGTSLGFIQAAAETMTVLDRNLELDWAELDCKIPTDDERSAEEQQEVLDRAVEKAIRDRERRRAREQREDDD